MANIKIGIVNSSTVLTDDEIIPAVAALQKQVSNDFAPEWGIDADVVFFSGQQAPSGYWLVAIMDNSDAANALWYHDLTSEGLPIGKVFAKTDIDNGNSWTVTLSHEIMEMLADSDVNLIADGGNGMLYAREVGDPVEADNLGYQIDGILLSDFVYRAWFEGFRQPNSTRFSHKGNVSAPFQLAPGGYISVIKMGSEKWEQIYARNFFTHAMRPKVGTRRERRTINRKQWIRSTNNHNQKGAT